VKDFNLKKPSSISGYPIHRAVAALTNGAPHLWRDNGETLTIRTSAQLDAEGVEVPSVKAGELRMFNLRACVASKVRGRHIYPERGDHKARQEWLGKQGQRHGFTVVAVHCTGGMTRVADQGRRDFAVDSTDFTGVLKVTDTVAFENALRCGVGNTGRAFGFSLLSI
jgi:hypothetical protein